LIKQKKSYQLNILFVNSRICISRLLDEMVIGKSMCDMNVAIHDNDDVKNRNYKSVDFNKMIKKSMSIKHLFDKIRNSL
jgi:hypothetical protein